MGTFYKATEIPNKNGVCFNFLETNELIITCNVRHLSTESLFALKKIKIEAPPE